jgi:hypothetical protein
MSMARSERRVMSFFSRSRVFSFSRKASTMLVPAEPSPITWTLFWYIRVVVSHPDYVFESFLDAVEVG